jgi:D-mannonate dehydratase
MLPVAIFVNYVYNIKITQKFKRLDKLLDVIFTLPVAQQATIRVVAFPPPPPTQILVLFGLQH